MSCCSVKMKDVKNSKEEKLNSLEEYSNTSRSLDTFTNLQVYPMTPYACKTICVNHRKRNCCMAFLGIEWRITALESSRHSLFTSVTKVLPFSQGVRFCLSTNSYPKILLLLFFDIIPFLGMSVLLLVYVERWSCIFTLCL